MDRPLNRPTEQPQLERPKKQPQLERPKKRPQIDRPTQPVNAFISYADNDKDLCADLVRHLSPLERKGVLRIWHHQIIKAGDDLQKSITENLNQAQLVLLLISSHFLASDHCIAEMDHALERRNSGVTTIPIIIRPCHWDTTEYFKRLQVLPKRGKPVVKWSVQDEAWTAVASSIHQRLMKPIKKRTGTKMPKNVK